MRTRATLFDGREELGDVDHRDEEEAIADGVRNEPEILAFHTDGVQCGGDVEHRQQRPPVEHAGRGAGGECRDGEKQIADDVHRWPDDRLEEHNEQRQPERDAASWCAEPRRALAQCLENPARPAIPLLDEIEVMLGRLGVRDRALLIGDVPARGEQLEREIGVLGEGVGVVAAGPQQARRGERRRSDRG